MSFYQQIRTKPFVYNRMAISSDELAKIPGTYYPVSPTAMALFGKRTRLNRKIEISFRAQPIIDILKMPAKKPSRFNPLIIGIIEMRNISDGNKSIKDLLKMIKLNAFNPYNLREGTQLALDIAYLDLKVQDTNNLKQSNPEQSFIILMEPILNDVLFIGKDGDSTVLIGEVSLDYKPTDNDLLIFYPGQFSRASYMPFAKA